METDSEQALELIETGEIENHPAKIIVQDCRVLLRDLEAELIHSLREGNRCADMLAKVGINQGEEDIKIVIPPAEVVELLKDDLKGIAFSRGF